MDDPISFGQWLKRRRRTLDLTQAELAQRAGCAMMTIQKIEADERRPSKEIAERLAAQLELAPDERILFARVARGGRAVDGRGTSAVSPLPDRASRQPVGKTSRLR